MHVLYLGKHLRALLYQNDMSMELVNLAVEREHIQEHNSSLFKHSRIYG